MPSESQSAMKKLSAGLSWTVDEIRRLSACEVETELRESGVTLPAVRERARQVEANCRQHAACEPTRHELVLRVTARADGVFTIRIAGVVDAHTLGKFDAGLRTAIAKGAKSLLLDCADLSYVSSAGFGALIRYFDRLRAGGGSLVLARVPPKIRVVLGVDSLVPIMDSLEGGLAAAAARWGVIGAVRPLTRVGPPRLSSLGLAQRWKTWGITISGQPASGHMACPACGAVFNSTRLDASDDLESKLFGRETDPQCTEHSALLQTTLEWLRTFAKEPVLEGLYGVSETLDRVRLPIAHPTPQPFSDMRQATLTFVEYLPDTWLWPTLHYGLARDPGFMRFVRTAPPSAIGNEETGGRGEPDEAPGASSGEAAAQGA